MGKHILNGVTYGGGSSGSTASSISYNNSTSGLDSRNVQAAITELATKQGACRVYETENAYLTDYNAGNIPANTLVVINN